MNSSNQLRADMQTIGINGAQLSNRLGVHRNTVSNWLTDAVPIPQYAWEWVRVQKLAKQIMEQV